MNGAARVQRYFKRLVDRLGFSEPVQRQQEQGLLNFEAHAVRRDAQTDEAGVNFFAFKERSEICRVVCNENEAVLDRSTNDRPVLPRPHPKPRDVRRFVEAPSPRHRGELGAQAFIDQELHLAGGRSRIDSFSDDMGLPFRQSGS